MPFQWMKKCYFIGVQRRQDSSPMTERTRTSVGHPVIHKKIDAWRKEAETKVMHNTPSMIKLLLLLPLGPSCLVLHVHKRDKLTSYYIECTWRKKHPDTGTGTPTTAIMGQKGQRSDLEKE